MSRRSIARAERVIVEGTTGTRTWAVAVRVPQTRQDRDPSWDRNNPTSRAEQKKQRAARRQS